MAQCHDVPVISQKTIQLCWEACAQMMWHWRYRSKSKAELESSYREAAGAYLRINKGLVENEMNIFYRQLGMRSAERPNADIIRHQLERSPVIFTSIAQTQGHAMVAAYYDAAKNSYLVVNPCGLMEISFDLDGHDSCQAMGAHLSAANAEKNLGMFMWYWP